MKTRFRVQGFIVLTIFLIFLSACSETKQVNVEATAEPAKEEFYVKATTNDAKAKKPYTLASLMLLLL